LLLCLRLVNPKARLQFPLLGLHAMGMGRE
jgi:hypothetical protein